jgi:hypothetical protein
MAKPKPKSILTAKQELAVEMSLDGKRTSDMSSSYSNPKVKEAVLAKRAELADTMQISRIDVLIGMQEAIDMARLAADPMSMIRGWTEIAKMLGLYAPEVKKIEMSVTGGNILSKYETMSDEELIRIAEGRTVEGEVIDSHIGNTVQ